MEESKEVNMHPEGADEGSKLMTDEAPQVKERQFKFMKKDTPESESKEIIVNESELTDDQLQATYLYLQMIFSNSPYKTQRRFMDELLESLSKMAESVNNTEIITPSKTIIDADGRPMKSPLRKVE
jgi:hypothetical protein